MEYNQYINRVELQGIASSGSPRKTRVTLRKGR